MKSSNLVEDRVRAYELEKQLKQWRETKVRKAPQQNPSDRRMVRVNGQEVVVVTKARSKPQG